MVFFCSSSPLGFYPIGASQPPHGIPAYGDTFFFPQLFSEMRVIEVGVRGEGKVKYCFGKLMAESPR